jgi:hypothetical protein
MKWQSKAVVGVAIVLSASAGWALKPGVVKTIRDTVIVELPPTELLDEIEDLAIENRGIRARLEARELRAPSVIYTTDTVVPPPDTVIVSFRVDAGGVATLAPLIRRDSLYAPEIWSGINLSDCDEGFSIVNGNVVCDRARLGHVEAFLRLTGGAGLSGDSGDVFGASGGLQWTPSYRSGWAVQLGIDVTGRVYFGLQRGIRIF